LAIGANFGQGADLARGIEHPQAQPSGSAKGVGFTPTSRWLIFTGIDVGVGMDGLLEVEIAALVRLLRAAERERNQ
jgi:hypothetical protein